MHSGRGLGVQRRLWVAGGDCKGKRASRATYGVKSKVLSELQVEGNNLIAKPEPSAHMVTCSITSWSEWQTCWTEPVMPPNTCHYLYRRHSAMLTKLMAANFESDREPSQQHHLIVSAYSACITAAAAGHASTHFSQALS